MASEKYVGEDELNAKAVAPRVTLESLEANVAEEHYLQPPQTPGTMSLCFLTLKNGFIVTGSSAAASPENFDADIGRRVARGDAVRQVWALMGYELRSKLNKLEVLKNNDSILGEALTRATAAALGNAEAFRAIDADTILAHFEGTDTGEEGGKTYAFSKISDTKLAEICYEVNKVWCEKNGDESFVPWPDAPQWQKDTCISGVQFHRANPDSLPEQSHVNWLNDKLKDGWKYGPVKDPEAKEHPCMVPYSELPDIQQFKDKLFVAINHAADAI